MACSCRRHAEQIVVGATRLCAGPSILLSSLLGKAHSYVPAGSRFRQSCHGISVKSGSTSLPKTSLVGEKYKLRWADLATASVAASNSDAFSLTTPSMLQTHNAVNNGA